MYLWRIGRLGTFVLCWLTFIHINTERILSVKNMRCKQKVMVTFFQTHLSKLGSTLRLSVRPNHSYRSTIQAPSTATAINLET